MPPRTHIHHVHSQPHKISPETWKQWYAEERSRDMVHFQVSATAAFYESRSEMLSHLIADEAQAVREMHFLALYQMGRTIPRYLDEYRKNVRVQSALWDHDRLGTCFDVAAFDSDHLELVEVLGSFEDIRTAAPYIIHTKIVGDEVEAKLQFDHVNAASRLGNSYRRSLLYRPVSPTLKVPYVFLIHEFDDDPGPLDGVKADMEVIEPSKDCAFSLRSFKLLHSQGFDGTCQMPERLEQ